MSFKILKTVVAALSIATTFQTGLTTTFAQNGFRYPAAASVNDREIPVATPIPTDARQSMIPVGNGVNGGAVVPAGYTQRSQRGLAESRPVAQPVRQSQQMATQRPGPNLSPRHSGVYRAAIGAGQPAGNGRVAPATYVPRHMRSAQLVSDVPLTNDASVMNRVPAQETPAPMTGYSDVYYREEYVEGPVVGEGYIDSGVGGFSDCDSCAGGLMSGWCGACDRGGCPPGIIDECWLAGLGGLLYRADYFAGAQCWDSPVFTNSAASDYNSGSGFYAGTNLGLPLCRITCGLLSGQIGVRSVNSEISGSPNISQLFVTGGFYRRVDYGLQFGAVFDYLQEDFLFQAQIMQIRGDISWVYAGGNALGFRFARGIQDDQVPDNSTVPLRLEVLDNYRFYYRANALAGCGYADTFLGWTDGSQILGGIDLDMPVTERVALQAGATYALPTQNPGNVLGGNADDAWNLYVGFVFRPQGTCYYQSYDRPILPVADNGSMILRRGF